ncbi:MAG TPA: hypothetical protein VFX09_05900 [Burkholderiales bacterium]|nr:hypothetical protein [Burkholderiales bacterium]
MPRALLNRLGRWALPLFALACAGGFAGAPHTSLAASAQVSIDVPRGKVKSVRLRHLPRGTVVEVAVAASGKLAVAMVSALQLKASKPRALFRGQFERTLSFKVVIPETSDYYLVLDNRRGSEAVKTTATIRAEQKGSLSPRPPSSPDGRNLEESRAQAGARA